MRSSTNEPPLRLSLHEAHLRLVQDYRKARRLVGDRGDAFDREVRAYFEAAVVRAYWHPLDRCVKERNVDRKKHAKMVGTADTTAWRWKYFAAEPKAGWDKNAKEPKLRNFLFTLVALGLAMEDVGFPSGPAAMRDGMREALARIRAEHLRKPWRIVSREEFAWLFHVLATGEWLAARQAGSGEEQRVVDRMYLRVRAHLPRAKELTVEDLKELIAEWQIPWALFYSANPFDWGLSL